MTLTSCGSGCHCSTGTSGYPATESPTTAPGFVCYETVPPSKSEKVYDPWLEFRRIEPERETKIGHPPQRNFLHFANQQIHCQATGRFRK